ncbi:MAG: arsenate reductase ArsC [Chloroflexota bacterium]|nr:arsenate reductase ArsC [Chloroflexota bacterium]
MAEAVRRVLFICIGNACRSQMAEAFFNRHAPEGWEAASAGVTPADEVSSSTVNAMAEVGQDISQARTKALTEEMVRQADKIVVVCGTEACPVIPEKDLEHWGVEDPIGQPMAKFRQVRGVIHQKVMGLISHLA